MPSSQRPNVGAARAAPGVPDHGAAPQSGQPPNADALDAFLAFQAVHGGKGKGPVAPFPQAWGEMGWGKPGTADPFVPMMGKGFGAAARTTSDKGRGHSRGRDHSRGRGR